MKITREMSKALFGGGLVLLLVLTLASHAVAQSCLQPPAGMVSWWPGDGNAEDIQNGNDGTRQNGATFAAGKVGQAFSFDGVDDFVEVPNSADFNPSGAFTVDGWFYIDPNAPSNAGDAATLVSKSDYQDTGGGWLLLFEDRTVAGLSKAVSFQVYQGQAAFVVAEAQNVVTTADWYHIAGVFDPTATPRAKLYLNGNLIGSSTTSISSATPNNLNVRIGAAYCNDANCTGTHNDRFNGLADEVEFFNVALTQAQIQAIFEAGSAGKCKASAAYSCTGFEPPFDAPILLKRKVKRSIPLQMQLFSDGTPITDATIAGAPPVVNVTYSAGVGPAVDVTDQLDPVGQSNEGNEFRFDPATGWVFNLSTQPFTAPGTYTVTVAAGDTSYTISPTCTGQFVRSE